MNRGRIEQIDTPEALRAAPATPFVYGFLGDAIRLEGRARAGQVDLDGLQVDCPEHREIADGSAVAFIRPHDIDVQRTGGQTREAVSRGITAQLQRVVQIGPIARLELSRDGLDDALEVQIPVERLAELSPHAGETLLLRPRRLKVFVESAAG